MGESSEKRMQLTSPPQAVSRRLPDVPVLLAAVVLLALLMLWVDPYRWPNTNHSQEVPPILALIKPGLYANDFAVQSFLGPTPRSAYQALIAALVKMGGTLPGVYFTLQSLTLLAVAGVVLRLAAWITAAESRALLLMTAGLLGLWMVASNHHAWNVPIVDGHNAVPSTFAMGFALWGWYKALTGRWGIAYSLFGAAAVLQFLVGFLPGMLLAPLAARDLLRGEPAARPRWALGGIAVWIVCLAGVALPMTVAARNQPALPAEELVRVFGFVRAPHHWIPGSAGALHWLNQACLAVAGALMALTLNHNRGRRTLRDFCVAVTSITAGLLVANYLFVERVPVAWIAKLQFQRAMPFAHLAILLVCVCVWQDLMESGKSLAAFAVVLAPIGRADGAALLLLAIGCVLQRSGRPRASSTTFSASLVVSALALPWPDRFVVPPALLMLAGLAAVALIYRERNRFRPRLARASLLSLTAVAVALTSFTLTANDGIERNGFGRMLLRQAPRLSAVSEFPPSTQELAALVRVRVPERAIILGPVWSLEAIPLLSERGVVLSWKNIPYSDAGIREWGERLSAILGFTPQAKLTEKQLNDAWRQRSEADLSALARRYGAEFIISQRGWHAWPPEQLLGQAGPWQLWRNLSRGQH